MEFDQANIFNTEKVISSPKRLPKFILINLFAYILGQFNIQSIMTILSCVIYGFQLLFLLLLLHTPNRLCIDVNDLYNAQCSLYVIQF